ncbi:MAG TPA: thermonuclease family protein [Limnobacter sp.]|nr:thermonuclease family protein [Limnobacter sp.]
MILKLLGLLLALLSYYFSPYGPGTGPIAKETLPGESRQMNAGSFYLAKVTKVADGDTLTVRNTDGAVHKIRMHGIDAPEMKQASGEASRDWLAEQVLDRQVKILVNDTDRYKRQVAKVVIPVDSCQERQCEGETDINLQAVQAGHAWWYREYARTQSPEDRQRYEHAENEARQARKGLWSRPSPKAPWEWRAEQRNQQR